MLEFLMGNALSHLIALDEIGELVPSSFASLGSFPIAYKSLICSLAMNS